MKYSTVAVSLLAGSAVASPIFPTITTRQTSAASMIGAVSPAAASRADCPTTQECRSAAQVAPLLIEAMAKYGVGTMPEIAAIVSLMAFESADFQYKHNVSPGRPGQGTANMQMFNFNLEYAKSIPELASQVSGISASGATDAQMNQVLSLVTDDKYNFGSGPWYYSQTACADARESFAAKDIEGGFTNYMKCVGASPSDTDRQAYWTRAKKAFNVV